ncbi:hypothetical protein [Nostoc sp. KVJ20]|uniref:hypothetical protein n=1 Tax=Nostoc sp. KVJ20 TaxID=457944 RepID=UPI00159EFAC1|nr:hypothetical protein [Nostoc sp. KVJ20]
MSFNSFFHSELRSLIKRVREATPAPTPMSMGGAIAFLFKSSDRSPTRSPTSGLLLQSRL